ncbi:Txe/YoeB family addiction module toxin [Ferrovibrio sp.]|uniref:Txe/YoeB family addiction module toxin n=1 Tax=Ferrovibrio sp. TaxID=1917215 RepID=UPI0025C34B50|nr:Txe/YoeB family addiction module toxin [Ferrovibrio sp.]MBX3456131.1 Txe/YoeB family addiction module toxin [Ferrovibrio sp.]
MNLTFTPRGWDDYLHWQTTEPDMVEKINALLRDIRRDPFRGLGKPEPLKNDFAGWWSRRITAEHRLVYRVTGKGDEQRVEIAQCRYHYS